MIAEQILLTQEGEPIIHNIIQYNLHNITVKQQGHIWYSWIEETLYFFFRYIHYTIYTHCVQNIQDTATKK